MLGNQFKILGLFFVDPRKAASLALDQGRLLFALLAAVMVTFAAGRGADVQRARETVALFQAMPAGMSEDATLAIYGRVRRQIDARYFASNFSGVVVMAIVFAPVCVLLMAALFHLGGAMTVLFRDYVPVLVGLSFAWTAAQLALTVAWGTGLVGSAGVVPLQLLGLAYFFALAGMVLSTVTGVSVAQALGAGVGGVAASAGASLLLANSGRLPYLLASPWVLYLLISASARTSGRWGAGWRSGNSSSGTWRH